MSDHRERACPHCGSFLHVASKCAVAIDAKVDAELREMGVDPDALAARGSAFVKELLAKREAEAGAEVTSHDCCPNATGMLFCTRDTVVGNPLRWYLQTDRGNFEIAYCPWCGSPLSDHPDPYVCPCCHEMGRCAPGCFDAAMERDREEREMYGDPSERFCTPDDEDDP